MLLSVFVLSACGKDDDDGNPPTSVDNGKKYVYQKNSDEMLYFETSNDDINTFLNDYYKRHVGYVDEEGTDYSVHTLKPGLSTSNAFYQEWMSMSFFWYNSFDGLETDRYTGQKNSVASIPVDDYGYVWCDSDAIRPNLAIEHDSLHRMGWPFPTATNNSGGYSRSWMFNGDAEGNWSSNIGASLGTGNISGLFYGSFQNKESIEFESYEMGVRDSIRTYFAPWIELDLRMFVYNYEDIDDVYIWFTNEAGEEFSEEKCVSAKEVAPINYEFSANYQHLLYFPMYAHPAWGDKKVDKGGGTYEFTTVNKIKVEIRAKEGKTLSGECGLNHVRMDYETRHANNNGILITSLKNDYAFTGDLEYLKANITRARKAFNFYMQMFDGERNLVYSSYLVGHDGDKTSINKAIKSASALGNGYWDASYMPEYDFQTNMYFYKGLVSMAYLEKVAEDLNLDVPKSDATVKTALRQSKVMGGESALGVCEYNYTSSDLNALAQKVLAALREPCNDATMRGFYNQKTGRFASGYDVHNGYLYDYGYTVFNTEAVYLGIADEAQSKSIMDWISGKRIVESDKKDDDGEGDGSAKDSGIGGSTGADIYYFGYAPRVTTKNSSKVGTSLLNGVIEADRTSGNQLYHNEFGLNEVQNGGAMLWSSYYDLMARLEHYGVDDAYDRLMGICNWYLPVYNYHVSQDDAAQSASNYESYFYYDYYAANAESLFTNPDTNLLLQGGRYGNSQVGGNASGVMGIDSELVESNLLISAIPLGFFGLDSNDGRTLSITPSLPKALSYWKIENLAFNRVKYDLTIYRNSVRIDSVRGNSEGLTVKVAVNMPSQNSKVYVNGKETSNYTVSNGRAIVTVSLNNTVIEVK